MKNKSRNERLNKLSDALFGAPEELTAADAADDLEIAGVDREELFLRMYEKLCVLARDYRLKGEEPPHRLKKALEDLRKRAGPPRTREECDRRADSTIAKLLEAVKRPKFGLPKLAFSSEFRSKTSEQSAEDQRIIENLEEELKKDLEREEEENQD